MEAHVNEDTLSHAPINFSSSCKAQPPSELVLLTEHLKESSVIHEYCKTHSIINSWSDSEDSSLPAYYLKQEELSVDQGCLLYVDGGST